MSKFTYQPKEYQPGDYIEDALAHDDLFDRLSPQYVFTPMRPDGFVETSELCQKLADVYISSQIEGPAKSPYLFAFRRGLDSAYKVVKEINIMPGGVYFALKPAFMPNPETGKVDMRQQSHPTEQALAEVLNDAVMYQVSSQRAQRLSHAAANTVAIDPKYRHMTSLGFATGLMMSEYAITETVHHAFCETDEDLWRPAASRLVAFHTNYEGNGYIA